MRITLGLLLILTFGVVFLRLMRRGAERAEHVDAVSDPALSDEAGHDWSAEGGATPAGPATDLGNPRTEATDQPAG